MLTNRNRAISADFFRSLDWGKLMIKKQTYCNSNIIFLNDMLKCKDKNMLYVNETNLHKSPDDKELNYNHTSSFDLQQLAKPLLSTSSVFMKPVLFIYFYRVWFWMLCRYIKPINNLNMKFGNCFIQVFVATHLQVFKFIHTCGHLIRSGISWSHP